MSAYMVSDEHIDALLTAAVQFLPHLQESPLRYWWDGQSRYVRREDADRVGTMLRAENQKSVNYRYSEDEAPQPYAFQTMRGDFAPVDILKAIQGFEYQACEHPEFRTSEAYAFCDALRHRMINRLPGYRDSGAWSINNRDFFRTGATR